MFLNNNTHHSTLNTVSQVVQCVKYRRPVALTVSLLFQTDKYEETQEENDPSNTKIHYAVLQSEVTGEVSKELEESEKIKYSDEVSKLSKSIEAMENETEDLKRTHEERMNNVKEQYSDITAKLQNITDKLMQSGNNR